MIKTLRVLRAKYHIPGKAKGKNRKYEKFFIFSFPRSGSSLLVALLHSHPALQMYGEIFNWKKAYFNNSGLNQNEKKYRTLRQHHPVEFLNEVIFRPNYKDSVKGVGFKLHPQQLLKYSKWQSIWPELAGLKNLKIINLRRENLLRSYVSREIAKKTGVYHIAHQDKREMGKIQINSGKWHKYMTAREQEQIDFKRRFNHHAIYNMTYERLIDNRAEELEKVQKFLNLPEYDLSARLVRQNPYPLNEIIINFDELKREHANTEWSHFFTEQS